MRAAMAQASVGDDVFSEDPTVNCFKSGWPKYSAKKRPFSSPGHHVRPDRPAWSTADQGMSSSARLDANLQLEQVYASSAGWPFAQWKGRRAFLTSSSRGLVPPDNEHAVRTRLVCLGEHAQWRDAFNPTATW